MNHNTKKLLLLQFVQDYIAANAFKQINLGLCEINLTIFIGF